jgi:membrane-associated protease RseP (regulator of RpoE activity)
LESPQQESVAKEQVISEVKRLFTVNTLFYHEDGSLEFRVAPTDSNKPNFVQLIRSLKPRGYLAFMRRVGDDIVLAIGRATFSHKTNVRVAGILFLATFTTVTIDGWIRSSNDPLILGSPVQMALLYALGLMGILGIHELGHKIAAIKHRFSSSLPYFIPGIPVIPGIPGFGIPTFGAVITSREPVVNRDTLFDLGFSGPLAGMLVTLVVTYFGALTSQVISVENARALLGTGLINLNPSILMAGIFTLIGKSGSDMTVVLSPLGFAAWLGFLIHFLNLLPAWQLDGGHMARSALSLSAHRVATYASIILLIVLGFLPMAILILLFSARRVEVRPLDDVSKLSKKRRYIFVAALALAALAAPIPILF